MIGRVYKIVHSQSKICYVGSTFNTLVKRWQNHKLSANKCCIAKYFKIYGIDQFKIMLIKEYEVCDRKHLFAYEQLWISKLSTISQKNTLYFNKQQRKQWYEANKDKISEKASKWYEANKDKIREQMKIYYEANKEKNKEKKKQKYVCECGSESTIRNKARHERTKKHQAFYAA